MNAAKLLTLCVPGYNVEKYLEQCVGSMAAADSDALEILIVDDGSTDGTGALAQKLQTRHPQSVRYLRKENGGHGSTINAGIREGTGKYFRVVDGDDWLDTHSLVLLLKRLGEIDADLVLTQYHKVHDVSGEEFPVTEEGIAFGTLYHFHELDVNKQYFSLASSTFRLDILKKMNFLIQEKTFYVDVEYIIAPIPFIETVIFYDFFLYKYRIGLENQSINLRSYVRLYDHHMRVATRMLDYIYTTPMQEKQFLYCKRIMSIIIKTQYVISLKLDRNPIRALRRLFAFDAFLRNRHRPFYDDLTGVYITLIRSVGVIATKAAYDAWKIKEIALGWLR